MHTLIKENVLKRRRRLELRIKFTFPLKENLSLVGKKLDYSSFLK